MGDSYTFAVDVFRTVCDRIAGKATDLRWLAEAGSSFEDWLTWEAFLACKFRGATYPFCEVAAKPTYASEGVADGGDDPGRNFGDLRVGGPNGGANHCWVFAEFALLHDGNRIGSEWPSKVEADASRLKRLGWKKSAALLVVVAVSRGDAGTEWADFVAGRAVWNQPALTDPFVVPLPGGGYGRGQGVRHQARPDRHAHPGGPVGAGYVGGHSSRKVACESDDGHVA